MSAKQFKYGLIFRPASLGAIPSIPHQVEPPLEDEHGRRLSRHGILVTERPLTEKELVGFELSVIADDDLKEELAIHVALDMRRYAEPYLAMATEDPEDFHQAINDGLRRSRPYRVYVGDADRFALMVKSRLEGALTPSSGPRQ